MNDLKTAIKKFWPGHCPRCGNNLKLITTDATVSKLDESGQVVSYIQPKTDIIGVCDICNNAIPMKRVGLYFIPDYELRRELRCDEKILDEFTSVIIDGKYSDNPFGKEE